MENKFNLVQEPWIPVAGKGLASLETVFSDSKLSALGGNPVQKIALTKLLLAIAQAAYTPKDDADWKALGAGGMAKKSLDYLKAKKDLFWLYGDKPFLQMPEIHKAEVTSFGSVQPYIASGNTTVLTQIQAQKEFTDADKALLLVQLMGFGLGGKKTDNSIVLSQGYQGKYNDKGKPATGKPGPCIGFYGFLHTFLQGANLQTTLWLNMLTEEDIGGLKMFACGMGDTPWEKMPRGEDCQQAQKLRDSYMGRLLPLSRFILLTQEGLHYSEGILHHGYNEGIVDISAALDFSASKPRALWVDPGKRPWRQLPALLSFMGDGATFDCLQLRLGFSRAKQAVDTLGVWSGGLRVASKAGEQYVSGLDDFVESEVCLKTTSLEDSWFPYLKCEMDELDAIAKTVYVTTVKFYGAQKAAGMEQGKKASGLFWQLCERRFQDLVYACDDPSGMETKKLRPVFARFAAKAYDTYCPKATARQLDAWAANRPNLVKYLA